MEVREQERGEEDEVPEERREKKGGEGKKRGERINVATKLAQLSPHMV